MENLQLQLELEKEIKKLNTIVARRIFAIDVDCRIEILVCEKNLIEVQFDTGEKHILPYNEYSVETIEGLLKLLK
jgi:hypothetical protein